MLLFMFVGFFAIWLDWWNLTIMLFHLFIRVPFYKELLAVLRKSFRNIARLVFLGFIMIYAVSYIRLLAAVNFKTEQADGSQVRRDLHSAARRYYGDESFFGEQNEGAETLLQAMT